MTNLVFRLFFVMLRVPPVDQPRFFAFSFVTLRVPPD
jgi:hypothetical protein